MKAKAYCEHVCFSFKVIDTYKYFFFQTDNRKEQITPTTALQFLVSCRTKINLFQLHDNRYQRKRVLLPWKSHDLVLVGRWLQTGVHHAVNALTLVQDGSRASPQRIFGQQTNCNLIFVIGIPMSRLIYII